MAVFFDDSLRVLAEIVRNELGSEELSNGVALRDTSGRLCFFASFDLPEEQRATLGESLTQGLGRYARVDRVIAGVNDFGAEDLLASHEAVSVPAGELSIRLIDRRLVGADWLRDPIGMVDGPPRIVFASLKGGVGRSTALSVAASHAASRGRRVLAIDLDLEAPGLGAMLLNRRTTPAFGMIDALVESALGPLDPSFLADLVGPSPLTDRGRIDVLPAFGLRSLQNPGDVLPKIARAYSESVGSDGSVSSVLDRVGMIVSVVSALQRYDLVLVDARAGLHETAASALLGLGAEILFFGLDETQTFQGYSALFGHMRRYAKSRAAEREWLDRVNIVHAKAPTDAELRADFSTRCGQMIAGADISGEPRFTTEVPIPNDFGNVPWDDSVSDAELGLVESQEFETIPVLYDKFFTNFSPHQKRDQILERIYRGAFGALLDHVEQIIDGPGETTP